MCTGLVSGTFLEDNSSSLPWWCGLSLCVRVVGGGGGSSTFYHISYFIVPLELLLILL